MALFSSVLFLKTKVHAQKLVYKLDVKEGMPDNHVYGSITDHLGYLWLTTPKGIVRYNGYGYKIFGINEGLPTEDNWCLVEDRFGRIWINNISHELGYIKNDRYCKFIFFEDLFYPRRIMRSRNGVAVLGMSYYLSNPKGICKYIVCDKDNAGITNLKVDSGRYLDINLHLGFVLATPSTVTLCRLDQQQKRMVLLKTGADTSYKADWKVYFTHFLCSFNWGGNFFSVTDLKGGKPVSQKYFLPDQKERITYAYSIDTNLYFVSDKNVYIYNELLQMKESYSIAALTGNEKIHDQNFCIFNRDPLWGAVLSSTDKGAYIHTGNPVLFRKAQVDLKNFNMVGQVNDSFGYWWDNNRHLIRVVKRGKLYQYFHLPEIKGLRKVEVFSGDTLMLTCADRIYLLKDKDIVSYGRQFAIKASVVVPDKTAFLIYGGGATVLSRCSLQGSKTIGPAISKSMTYDKMRHGLWLYHNMGISFYDIGADTFHFIKYAALLRMGIKKVEAIVVDPVYGNVFIKDVDKIYLLSQDLKSVYPLLTRYRHYGAKIFVNGNRLLVGGRIGLLSLPVCGKGKFKEPDIYENIKDHYYNNLSDLHVCGDYAMLKTDKGLYELKMNRPEKPGDASRIIARFADTVLRLGKGDTLFLQPGTFNLSLDLIHPNGRGEAVFSYAWGEKGRWKTTEGNNIDLNELKPYHWYKLYLHPRDDVWNGLVTEVNIRKMPYWWQTYYFIAGMILSGLVICFGIVMLTRKTVLKKHLEKQLMLELSMDAIYARINPHFIFNTLSVVQYHIKANRMNAAAGYVNRFSRLLRSYLRSSKLRYISIREEIMHLEDYIVLQQERFEKVFSYTIDVEDAVDQSLEIPTMLLQPLVENAIRHGLWQKKGEGRLTLSFKKLNGGGGLCIRIEDNGIGRQRSKELNKDDNSASYGNELIHKLMHVFNTYEKIKLGIEYIDKIQQETGTIVIITIQYLPR